MQTRRTNPSAVYRLLQNERINASDSLGQKFPRLKALTVNLEYFDPTGLRRNGGSIKYKTNIENAKSALCFNCRGEQCVGGDYDLSEELSRAIKGKRKTVIGEKHCQGVRHNLEKRERVSCQNLLRYVLQLGYL